MDLTKICTMVRNSTLHKDYIIITKVAKQSKMKG
jgi:hypothetical protein